MAEQPLGQHWFRRALDVFGAAAAALLAFTAVPAVLVVVVGNPLSGGLGHTWQPAWRGVLAVTTIAAWVAWAACCCQLARAVVARVRTGEAAAPATALDRLAARIAVGILTISSFAGPLALAASAGAATASPSPPSRTSAAPAPASASWAASEPPSEGLDASGDTEILRNPQGWFTVRDGDSLWGIADAHLQDGAQWTTLAALNLGRDVGAGHRFVDPAHVEPGWRLRLPADAAGPVHADLRPERRARAVDVGKAVHEVPHGPSNDLPEIAALGMGSLVCAGLARRSRWRRRPPRFSEDPEVALLLSDEAVDTAVLVERFAGVPALASFESANRLLGWVLEGQSEIPALRAVHVTSQGVTFWLTGVGDPERADGFAPVEGGQAWHVDHGTLADVADRYPQRTHHQPFAPVTVPVGDDDEGTWLIAVGPGQVLPVLGAAAPAMMRAMRSALGAWAWSDTLFVSDDPADPAFSAEVANNAAIARHLVYFGAPASISDALARRAAVVTTSAGPASDVTVLVDRHGATIHPLGRVVRPHLQSDEVADSVKELLSTEPRVAPPVVPRLAPRVEMRVDPQAERAGQVEAERAGAPPAESARAAGSRPVVRTGFVGSTGPVGGTAAVTPGIVDVRLLTMTPRLDGLAEELPPNRVRRAVELVAYLALHHPDVITSDRLRTRVLGSADADAASKTLFNVAHAARRALGSDEDGAPLLPPGTRNGLYQISAAVTVDATRAAALASEGRAYADRDAGADQALAIAHFRAALDLVEGEPLANALSGYTWWEAEGHGGRISAVLVDAACTMAALTSEYGQFDLARWGVERARLVAPYSESLSRAAMRVAAAEGDPDRLRREWDECQRRLDELDPGSSPSPRTEALYGELRRRVPPRHPVTGSSWAVPALSPDPSVSATSDPAPTSAP